MLPLHGEIACVSRLAGRLQVTERARSVMRDLHAASGAQCLVLCWPGGVAHMPSALHRCGPYDVVIGHVARSPIYADLRQLALFRDRRIVLDAPEPVVAPRPPLLRVTLADPAPPRALAGSVP